jgi:hypothetical protein
MTPYVRNVRIIRLQAAHSMLCHLNSQKNEIRSKPNALLTYAALVWLINGLHSRPPSDKAGRAVARAVLPLTVNLNHEDRLRCGFEGDEQDDDTPVCSGGMIFLRQMIFPPYANVARLRHSTGALLSNQVFTHIFGMPMEDLRRQMDPLVALAHVVARTKKRYRVARGTTSHRSIVPGEEAVLPESLEMLENIPLPRREIEWGHDMQEHHDLLDHEFETVAAKAHAIWLQFPSDILQKVGNPLGRGRGREASYCILDEAQRLEAKIDRFQNKVLSATFRKVNLRMGPREEWTLVFNRLFPPPKWQLPAKHQHYKHMRYYIDWVELMNTIRPGDVIKVRQAIKEEFDQLAWVPYAQSDRVWNNQWASNLRTYPIISADGDRHGPRVMWNPKLNAVPEWIYPREEEEEEEEAQEEEESGEDMDTD